MNSSKVLKIPKLGIADGGDSILNDKKVRIVM
jgi:hypothetical protein